MNLVAEARAIMALLQPLQGARSTGNAVVNAAPGPSAVLPGGSYAMPIVNGAARWDQLLKVPENPSSPDGWPVTTATSVPIFSNLGGAVSNLPAGTELRWFPTLEGIEPASVVGPGGLVGGTQLTGITAVQQLVLWDEIGIVGGADALAKALVGRYPALVLQWESSGQREFTGRNQYLEPQLWSVFIITSRNESDPARRLEGMALIDLVRAQIEGRSKVDGFAFSNNGIWVTSARLAAVTPAWRVYQVRFQTQTSTAMKEYRTYNPWIRTRFDITTPTPAPDGLPVVVDNEVLMPQ